MVFWTKLSVDERIGGFACRKSSDVRVIVDELLIKEMTIADKNTPVENNTVFKFHIL